MDIKGPLPTKETPYERLADYPYVVAPKEANTHEEERDIRAFILMMWQRCKVVIDVETANPDIGVAKLAEHEIHRRLGTQAVPNAAYYDVSGLPFRMFYRVAGKVPRIEAPLKVFGRRYLSGSQQNNVTNQATRDQAWANLADRQSDPIHLNSGQHLPTHGAFPRCVQLITSAPDGSGSSNLAKLPNDKWRENPDFTMWTGPPSGLKTKWTQERILVRDDDPVFSNGFASGKVPVFHDDRREGSPSSPLVTLLMLTMSLITK